MFSYTFGDNNWYRISSSQSSISESRCKILTIQQLLPVKNGPGTAIIVVLAFENIKVYAFSSLLLSR
uniref:Type X protein phosphatase-II n=1 Tax=Rhizophora mucronata TaxID=61149 RepID=A0A2P2M8B4_RHIMU